MPKSNPVRRADALLSTDLPDEAVALDPTAFDRLVHHQGVALVHHRAVRCPVGLRDESDARRVHADHSGCSNGFIYVPIGRVTCVFTSNATDPRMVPQGFYDGSTVVVTFPRFYDSDSSKRVLVRPFDRLYLEEEDVRTGIWDVTHRRQDGLPDRVEFPMQAVEQLVDSSGAWWFPTKDFTLDSEGNLHWEPGRGPPPGTVYTAWYQYRPFWYVDRLVHEIRVTPVRDFMDQNVVRLERLAFGAVLHREYVYRDQQDDELAPDNRGRKQRPPDQTSVVKDPQDDFSSA